MERVLSPEHVLAVAALLVTASAVTLLARRLRIPAAVGLVLAGLALHLLTRWDPLVWLSEFELTPELILYVFLPTLLFEAAFNIDSRQLFRNLAPIVILAAPVLLVSVVLVGLIVAPTIGMPLGVALIFGALISATDPVAVLAVFREIGAPSRLAILVDGESLFNDGTAFVVFNLLVGILAAGTLTAGTVAGALGEFVVVVAGGLAVGIIGGVLVAQIIGRVHADQIVESTLVLILGYAVFVVADHIVGVSGVMAAVAAGLVMGNYGRTKISPPVLGHVHALMAFIASAANSLVFLLVGLSVNFGALLDHPFWLAWVVLAVLVARGVPMFLAMPLVNRVLRQPVSLKYQIVMYWGGLRGALALALVLSLDQDFAFRDTLINLTYGVVLFTLLVPGLSMRGLLRVLGLQGYTLGEAFERRLGRLMARREVARRLDATASMSDTAAPIESPTEASQSHDGPARPSAEDCRPESLEMDAPTEAEVLLRHCLAFEMQIYRRLFARGDLTERVMKHHLHQLQLDLDELGTTGGMPVPRPLRPGAAWSVRLLAAAQRLPLAGRLLAPLATSVITDAYDGDRAAPVAVAAVLDELAALAGAQAASPAAIDAVRTEYRERAVMIEDQLAATADQYPEYVEVAQRQVASRHLLHIQSDNHQHLHEAGLISDRVYKELEHETRAALRNVGQVPLRTLTVDVRATLMTVPMFQDLPGEVIEALAGRLHQRAYARGDAIVSTARGARALFVIGRGAVRLEVGAPDSAHATTLRAGDFFGDLGLITSTESQLTAVALTPCHLLVLSRRRFERTMREFPDLRSAAVATYQATVLVDLLAGLPFLAMLQHAEVVELASRFTWRQVPAGTTIYAEGDRDRNFYVVTHGRARAEVTQAGRPTPVREIVEAGFFGEMVLFGDEPRTETIVAVTDLEMLTVAGEEFVTLLSHLPPMGDRLRPT